ncbi:hypothetical protein ABPG72_022573 [Tetrahymena utriculariae]
MNSFQKFSQEHLKVLCQRGISALIVFVLLLKTVYSGVTIFSGVSFPFQDSLLGTEIFFHRTIIFCILSTALIFQLCHLFIQKAGLISKLVLILLLASLFVNLNSQQEAKSLFIEKDESVTQLDDKQKCLNNSKLLWPSLSYQLYDEANKMNCSQNCPCTNKSDAESNKFANFQACLADRKSLFKSNPTDSNVNESNQENISYSHTEQINQNQQYQRIVAMQKLSNIEQYLSCSGICESNQNYFFWDVSQKPKVQGTCYSIAANQIQEEILLYTKNYTLTILFCIICTLIQEIFLYKSTLIIQFAKSKLGACISLPITASQSFNQLNDESEKSQESERKEQKIKIHLIDLPKKIIPLKNKEQKCILKLKVSPKLLKSESDIHSPEDNNELPKIITKNYQDSNPHEQN